MGAAVRTIGFALAALALCGLGVALARGGGASDDRGLEVRADGAVVNSKEGQSILTATHMAPGDSVSGTVTLTNGSGEPAGLTLSQSVRSQVAGLGGAGLLDELVLEVRDSEAVSPAYFGPPSGLRALALPDLASAETRIYSLTATLPATAGDALQDASASLDFAWTATGRTPAPISGTEPACTLGRVGSVGADTLTGTGSGDRIFGRAGNDRISGRRGADCLYGGTGDDHLYGGSGHDQLQGGMGRDVLVGGSSIDLVSGGNDDDTVFARDGVADRIRCGTGSDLAVVDPGDRIAGCERVRYP